MIKAFARLSEPWNRNIEIYISEYRGDKLYAWAESLSMFHPEEKDMGMMIQPTFRLEYTEAQLLMDELWNCGFRPSEGTGSAGALAATQKHLEDMRKLVFEK